MMRLFAVLTALALFCAASPALAHEGDTYTIQMYADRYEPKNITIKQNDTITFVNKSGMPLWPASNIHPTHEIYSEFDPAKPVPAGVSWSFTFTKAGVWRYHDHLVPTIVGTVTVQGDTHAAPTPTPRVSALKKAQSWLQVFLSDLKIRFLGFFMLKESKAIWTDDSSLQAYIRKYGADQTIAQLHNLGNQGMGNCHQRAHKAGRLTYEMTGEASFAQSPFECHSGYFHGVMEAFFRDKGTQNLAENLKRICARFTGNVFANHQCVHGIGHGLMAWSDYELFESLKNCDLLPAGHESCYSGVFMENVVGGLAKDTEGSQTAELVNHFTSYLSDDPQYPCTIVDAKYQGSCYYYQTSRMVDLFGQDFKKISAVCQSLPQEYRYLCFASMGRDVSGIYAEDLAAIRTSCGFAPSGVDRTSCFTGAVNDIFWDASSQDTALAFCASLSDTQEKSVCYHYAFLRGSQLMARKDFLSFCAKAESEYRKECMAL